MRYFFLALALYLAMPLYCVEAETVEDLAQSISATKVPANRENSEYQIGTTDVDPTINKTGRLNKVDPLYGLIIRILGITLSTNDSQNTLTLGLMELPYDRGHFVGWVQTEAPTSAMSDTKLTIGLLEKDPANSQNFRLVGKLMANIPVKREETMWSFDFAPYNLGSLGRAFGIRTMLEGCGAGGSICSNTYLRLFVPQKDTLQNVFTEAVGSYGNYSGDWHKDGTRAHTVKEQNATISIAQNANSPIPDLVMKLKEGQKWLTQTFSPTTNKDGFVVYVSAGRGIITHIDDDSDDQQ